MPRFLGAIALAAVSVALALLLHHAGLPKIAESPLPVPPRAHSFGPPVVLAPLRLPSRGDAQTAPRPRIALRPVTAGTAGALIPSTRTGPRTHVVVRTGPVKRSVPHRPAPKPPATQPPGAKPPIASSPSSPTPTPNPTPTPPVQEPSEPVAAPAPPPVREPASSPPPVVTPPVVPATPPVVVPPTPPVVVPPTPPVETRPGNGWGDKNHDHTGPPGHNK